MELSEYVCIRKNNIIAYPKNIDFNIGDHVSRVELFDKSNLVIEYKSEVIYFEDKMYMVDAESFRNNFIHIDTWRSKQLDSVLT
jgi:hypothetical protein